MSKFFMGLSILLLVLSGFSCARGPENASLSDTKAVMKLYDRKKNQSMQDVDALVMKGKGAVEEMKPFINDKDPKVRWIAVYVIGRVADPQTAKMLLPLLQDEDDVVRISAAGTLANKGVTEALPVLIGGLDSSGSIEYLSPQRTIAEFCLDVLSTYTKQPLETKQDWQAWWEGNKERVQWDEAEDYYRF